MKMKTTLAVMLLTLLAACGVAAQSTWNGSVSTSWSNAANWTPSGVPTATSNVTIPTGVSNYPTLDATANVNSLTINAGATLSASNRTMNVTGNWTNNGTFIAGTGTVEFNGGTSASIGGSAATTFNQLICRKSSMSITLTCTQTITVNGSWPNSLVLDSGTFDVAAATVTAKGLWSNYSSGGVKQFRMNNAAGKFICDMCSFGANNTSATMSAGIVECTGELMAVGDAPTSQYSALNFTGGTIIMAGPSARLALYDGFTHNSKSFVNLQIGKAAGDKTILTGSVGGGGTGLLADLIVTGQLKIVAGATLALKSGSYAQYNAILSGSFVNDGTLDAQAGLVTINGTCALSGAATTNFASLTINSGATFSASSDLGFSGSFTNNGTFNAGGKTVSVLGSGTSVIGGTSNTAFATLSCIAAGKQINFTAGKTYTISTSLVLTGATGNLVKLRSSSSASTYTLADNGSESVTYVDVQDCVASNSITDYPGGADSGNNTNWVFGPVLSVATLTGTNGSVFNDETGGGLGYKAVSFSLSNSAAGIAASLTNLTVTGAGSGSHNAAYLSNAVSLYRESGATSGFDAGDVLVAATNFNATPVASFSFTGAESNFASGQSKQFYLVVKLNGSASAGQTFDFQVTALSVAAPTTTAGLPSNTVRGFSIIAPTLTIADNSSATQTSTLTASTDNVIQKFTLTNTLGPANTISAVQVKASGTGNDATDYTAVKLYRDANANSTFEPASDTLVDTKTAFPADDGSLSFALAGTEAQFAPSQTRQYFIVVDFANTMATTLNYATQITGIAGYNTGTSINGAPAPTAGPAAGIAVTPNALTVTLNGPASAQTVDSFAQGAGGIGLVLADVTLAAQFSGWTVNSVTFRASGSGNDATAFNYLALFADANNNGSFDGVAGGDSLAVAGAASAFAANDGDYTATLLSGAMVAATPRRFFLVAKLAGTASATNTFGAKVQSVAATQPQPGPISGAPGAATTALVIDAAALTVGNAPAAPVAALIEGGTAITHVIAAFRFTATNLNVPVTSIKLTTSGSGNWAADVSAVELWLDNGNGVFDTASDTQLASAVGAALVNLTPAGLTVPNGNSADVWIRLNLTASAAASIPKTFSLSIAAAADISATSAVVVLGTPAPASTVLSVIRFEVSQFTPAIALQSGGEPIVIQGSGFMAPVSLTIGGVTCPGTGVVNAAGTEISGFITPAGSGQNKVIVLNNGVLGARTLPMAFNYATAQTIGGSGGAGGGGGGGGCAAHEGGALALFMAALLALIAGAKFRSRRSA